MLGVPEALDLARTTVEDYERYDENFHAMDEKTRRMDTLRGIQQAYGEYAAARGKARAFEPVKPAVDGTVPAVLRDWALARMRGEVAVQLPADRAEQQNSEAEAKLLRRRTEDLRTRLDMIRGQMQGLDGGDLTRLELELDQARRTLEDVQANRTRIKQTFASIGETLPGDEQAWNERRINAVNFKREYNKRDGECEEALTAAINARAGARGDLERLQRDFDRQRSQRTRISQQMDETRAMLCRATGLTPAELPYVAELMDVNEHEEDWRLAMNVAYAPIAQTILVDKRHEQGFAAKVSTIDPRTMPRRTWQFVDTARHYDDTGAHANILTGEQDGDWLSGKLRYRDDSPFADWLRSQTQDERFDALCVTAIDDTDRTNRQVQADGQIKSGARGQHGTKDRAQVIGFVNESYLAQLRTRIQDAQRQCDETAQSYASAKEQADRLQRERELADQLAYTAWEKIDENSAKAAIADIERTIASVRNNPKLAELDTLQESL